MSVLLLLLLWLWLRLRLLRPLLLLAKIYWALSISKYHTTLSPKKPVLVFLTLIPIPFYMVHSHTIRKWRFQDSNSVASFLLLFQEGCSGHTFCGPGRLSIPLSWGWWMLEDSRLGKLGATRAQELQLQLRPLFPTKLHDEMFIWNKSSCSLFHHPSEAQWKTVKSQADWQVSPCMEVCRRTLPQGSAQGGYAPWCR